MHLSKESMFSRIKKRQISPMSYSTIVFAVVGEIEISG